MGVTPSINAQVEEVASHIGEGVHTLLRKICESEQAQAAHQAITAMPDKEWNEVARVVAEHIVRTMKYRRVIHPPLGLHGGKK